MRGDPVGFLRVYGRTLLNVPFHVTEYLGRLGWAEVWLPGWAYLTECGLDLHAAGELLENRPEAGAVVCRLGKRSVALGLAAAGKVLVSVEEREGPS